MKPSRAILGPCLAILIVIAPAVLRAQAPALPAAEPANDGHRYLLVLDTSRSMKSRVATTFDLVAHLISTGMDGRMRGGDTIGLWTFNSELHDGVFPLQTWTPERRRAIAMSVVSFLESTPLRNSTDLRTAIKAALEVVKQSDTITVVFLTGGEELFKGTPFDTEINAAFQRESRPMRSIGLPFAVFFVGRGGTLTDYAVNSPFQPLAYPEAMVAVAEPKPPPKTADTAKVATPLATDTNLAPATVQSGSAPATEQKPEPKAADTAARSVEQATKTESAPATVASETPSVVPPVAVIPAGGLVRTNEKGSVILPQPVFTSGTPTIRVVPDTQTEPPKPVANVTETKPAESTSAPSQPTAVVSTQPASSATVTTIVATVESTVQPAGGTTSTPPPTEPPQPPVVPAITPATVTSTSAPGPMTTTLAPVAQSSGSNALPAEPGTSPISSPPVTTSPTISTAAPPSSNGTSASVAQVNLELKSGDTASPPVAVTATRPTNAPALLIAAIPPEAGYSPRALLIAAFTLLGVAIGLVLLLMRRRTPASASIITRSMNRDKS